MKKLTDEQLDKIGNIAIKVGKGALAIGAVIFVITATLALGEAGDRIEALEKAQPYRFVEDPDRPGVWNKVYMKKIPKD